MQYVEQLYKFALIILLTNDLFLTKKSNLSLFFFFTNSNNLFCKKSVARHFILYSLLKFFIFFNHLKKAKTAQIFYLSERLSFFRCIISASNKSFSNPRLILNFSFFNNEIKRRLFDMGLTPTVDILLKKKAPFGDPIEVSVRGYELILRKSDASMIIVEV